MKKARHFALAAATIALTLAVLYRFESQVNVAAAGLLLVTVVTVCSVLWGSGPGLLAALIGVTGLNYFFIPPVHTFSIAGTENWIALIVFACCALIVGQLLIWASGCLFAIMVLWNLRAERAPTAVAAAKA